MGGSINKKSLNGIHIDFDKEFLSFAKERYNIYLLRKSGQLPPWTSDPILTKYRFTNIFRDDDKTSIFIYNWVEPHLNNIELLVANLIYARLCNKKETLLYTGLIDNNFDPKNFLEKIKNLSGGKTKAKVNKNPVWKGPYQVSGTFKKLGYLSREELIAYHILKNINQLSNIILTTQSNNIIDYLIKLNFVWGYNFNMVFTQVLLDLSYLKPDIILPTIKVPLSSGIEPLIENLKIPYENLINKAINLWNNEMDRKMQFKDAEHALCEFRKYLCWKNNTSNPRIFIPTL